MIGVIGCGNMASAIVKGIHQVYPKEKFLTYTPSFTRADQLASEVGGEAVKELDGLSETDSIIIGCKPQQFDDLASKLNATNINLNSKHFISIMAATPVKALQEKLGAKRVTRVMPNTPSLYNEGVSLILHSEEVASAEKELVLKYFSACSKAHLLEDEKSFDQVTTVSGSGPAYVFLFAKTMADKLKDWGIESGKAREIVTQLFKGSAKLMEINKDTSLDDLVAQVTSKGGVTIEAVNVYKERELDQITAQALEAAFKRSTELTREFGK